MAHSKPVLMSGDKVKELECIVCMEQVQLRLMTCGHRCCQDCINNLVEDTQLNCPYCRRLVRIPEEGLPVCRLTEYLKDQLKLNPSGYTSSHGKDLKSKTDPKCTIEDCDRHVDARCGVCCKFLCYRCGQRSLCGEQTVKHVAVDLSVVTVQAEEKLKKWAIGTEDKITAMKYSMARTQKEVDDCMSMLKVSEFIKSESDEVEKITLIEQICTSTLGLPVSSVPMRIEYISTHDTGGQCWTAAHQGDEILVGTAGGLKVFNQINKQLKLEVKGKYQVAQHKADIFLVHEKADSVSVLCYNKFSTDYLFSFPRQSNIIKHISATSVYVAVVDCDQGLVKFYSRQSKVVTDIKLPRIKLYFNICFTFDGSLLVTGYDDSNEYRLWKYRIQPGPDKPTCTELWSVKEAEQCTGVFELESGLIFLCGSVNRKIHMYDSEGTKLKEIKVEQLPDRYGDISIRGNELAVAGLNTNTLLLFEIIY